VTAYLGFQNREIVQSEDPSPESTLAVTIPTLSSILSYNLSFQLYDRVNAATVQLRNKTSGQLRDWAQSARTLLRQQVEQQRGGWWWKKRDEKAPQLAAEKSVAPPIEEDVSTEFLPANEAGRDERISEEIDSTTFPSPNSVDNTHTEASETGTEAEGGVEVQLELEREATPPGVVDEDVVSQAVNDEKKPKVVDVAGATEGNAELN
jgi:hypothetical protein